MLSLLRVLSRVLLPIAALAFAGQAAAQAVPYQAWGGAQFVSPTDFVGVGQATHLGRYTEVGSVAFAPTPDPDVLAVTGGMVYTAADGDELHATVVGLLNTRTGAITATVTYVGGTGRFASASGSAQLAGQMLGEGAVSVAVAGQIDY